MNAATYCVSTKLHNSLLATCTEVNALGKAPMEIAFLSVYSLAKSFMHLSQLVNKKGPGSLRGLWSG